MSSVKAVYQRYLANPDASAFAPDGSLNYITTLTTLNKTDAIAKHLNAQKRVLTKKLENVLSTVESENALCLEIETTIEFITGGGTYLPGLDDNFLADQTVTLPIIHVVQFDAQQKIQQVRLFWDQGCLLKQMEVIGSRGKNWPIRDGKDHVKLIKSSAAAASSNGTPKPTTTNGSGDPSEVVISSKPKEGRKTATRDPYASLSLFSGPDEDCGTSQKPAIAGRGSARPPDRNMNELFADNDEAPKSPIKSASPKKGARPGSKDQSAKPPPRDYHELFVGHEADASPTSKARPASPQKENAPIAPKAGAGKNFQSNRLFENIGENATGAGANAPNGTRKPHPTKFNHFDFGDENETKQQALPARPKTKHQAQWDFGDLSTPEKAPPKIRSQDVRHFGWGDDTGHESPAKHPNVPHPRPDAKSHFDFLDDATPPGGRRPAGLPRGHAADRGAGLYKDNIFDDDVASSPKKGAHPLSTVTNLKDRRKDLDPHYEISDEPSAISKTQQSRLTIDQDPDSQQAKIHPGRAAGKENKGIKTGGDGMGGRKDAVRSWGFGSESDEDGMDGQNGGKFQPAKKQQAPQDDDFWNY
ncbi:MAG: hypothetical protein Q9208_002643 [Pyrenodesmia sp. 3 TL-2023]